MEREEREEEGRRMIRKGDKLTIKLSFTSRPESMSRTESASAAQAIASNAAQPIWAIRNSSESFSTSFTFGCSDCGGCGICEVCEVCEDGGSEGP